MAKWYWKKNKDVGKVEIEKDVADQLERFFNSKEKKGYYHCLDFEIDECPIRFNINTMSLECASIEAWGYDNIETRHCDKKGFDHISWIKLYREGNYKWEWFDPERESWISLKGRHLESVEEEYQEDKKGKRSGLRVHHCFGDGGSAHIRFNEMETFCGSGRCILSHGRKGIDDDHMSFKLRRTEK